jgi:hypothetical protein
MAPVATTSRQSAHERRSLANRSPTRLSKPGSATLDDRITGLWSRLIESGVAECPVCGEEIAAGRPCGSCGSELW